MTLGAASEGAPDRTARGKRRSAFWIGLASFVAVAIVWALYVPYEAWRLFALVPPGATWVTVHDALAQRWPDVVANPIARSLLHTVGWDPQRLDEISEDPVFRRWLKRLAAKRTVVAYIPTVGDNEGGWLLVSWLGGGSQRLRWFFSLRNPFGIKELGRHRGRVIWSLEPERWGGHARLFFAFAEGVGVAAVAGRDDLLRDALDWADSLGGAARRRVRLPCCGAPDAPDRGWVRTGAASARPWSFAVEELQRDGLAGRVCGASASTGEGEGETGLAERDVGSLARWLGEDPVAVMGFSRATAVAFLRERVRTRWSVALAEALERLAAGGVVVAVLGGEYDGRWKGVRWPACVVLVPVSEESAGLRAALDFLDTLNAHYRWGLIAREFDLGGRRAYVVEATGDLDYAGFEVGQRVAYGWVEGWLAVGWSAEALMKLMARGEGRAGEDRRLPRWASAVPARGGPGFGWVDLRTGGRLLRLALTAYAVKLGTENPQGTRGVRQRLQVAKAWVDALAPLGECRWACRVDGGRWEVAFEAGAAKGEEIGVATSESSSGEAAHAVAGHRK